MKLLIAFAALLTSAMLTVPTVTDLGQSNRPSAIAAVASDNADTRNA